MINLDQLWEGFIATMLAIAGGLARLLNKKDKRALKLRNLVSDLFVAGFAGLMVYIFTKTSDLPSAWVAVSTGIAGWAGPRAIEQLAEKTGNKGGE